jgi:hypothetical protein
LVVGWGLPISLLRHIDAQGARFLDIEIAPLRFAAHLHLCARTNDARIEHTLEALEVPSDLFWDSASSIRALFARRGSDYLFYRGARVGIFAGQTEIDLALVQDGRLQQPEAHLDRIAQWAQEVDVLLVKPHPYGSFSGLADLMYRIPNAMRVDHNIYSMLCALNAAFIAALSSSVLQEAEYFGAQARPLLTPDRSNPARLPATCSRWIIVTTELGSMRTIEEIVRPSFSWEAWAQVSRGHWSYFAPDALDVIFNTRWGLDARAPGLPYGTRIEPNITYGFEARGAGAKTWLSMGWHAAEDWGAWSAASICCLLLPLSGACFSTPEAPLFVLKGRFFAQARIVRIDVDDHAAQPVFYRLDDGKTEIHIRLPSGALPKEGKLVRVVLHISDAQRPNDIQRESSDRRELGFGIESLIVKI